MGKDFTGHLGHADEEEATAVNVGGWKKVQEGVDICMHIADICMHIYFVVTPETNTTL